ncbi:ParB/RepB/Spo0J family partition protein [Streptomyces celluloflavus]|uniref:ParB/RepB/Spo0J family partition protein n=1 Tax=Streptomyces celluloflavus TaxID=58344 RepID=UPI0037AF6090
MAGRRTSLASLAGQKVDDVPGKSDPLLLTLPLHKLVPTRFNPRRNFGTEDLKEFGLKLKKRQLQPAVVVSRSGYLKLWPVEEENVGEVPYVIANGERRYRGSLAAGLTTLNVVHNEDVAASRADFLDAVLAENNDREDLDPIERALGIETMVMELGGADKVATHYGKTKGWVSQQRKLLKLTPELQDLVSSGDLPIRIARDIAGLPASEQAAAWAEEQQRRAAAQAAPRAQKTKNPKSPAAQPRAEAAGSSAVDEAAGPSPRFTAVNQPAHSGGTKATEQTPAVPPQATTAIQDSPGDISSSPQAARPAEVATQVPAQAGAEGDLVSQAVRSLLELAGDADGLADALARNLPAPVLEPLAEALLTHVG